MAAALDAVQKIAIYSVPMLLGIILHEVAHGYVAWRFGDPTAKALGRLTINPVPHIDPMGLLVFVVTSLTTPFVFGWAKPVPVDTRYFVQPRRALMYVSLAGPATNFALAIAFAGLLWAGLNLVPEVFWLQHTWAIPLLSVCKAGVLINLGLAWLNLVPIPPLDGSKIVAYFLPRRAAETYMQLERYGMLLLLLLIVSGALNAVVTPLLKASALLLLPFLAHG